MVDELLSGRLCLAVGVFSSQGELLPSGEGSLIFGTSVRTGLHYVRRDEKDKPINSDMSAQIDPVAGADDAHEPAAFALGEFFRSHPTIANGVSRATPEQIQRAANNLMGSRVLSPAQSVHIAKRVSKATPEPLQRAANRLLTRRTARRARTCESRRPVRRIAIGRSRRRGAGRPAARRTRSTGGGDSGPGGDSEPGEPAELTPGAAR